jgi:hypothetical protein
MRKGFVSILPLFIFISLNTAAFAAVENKELDKFEINSKFQAPGVSVSPNSYILDYKTGDVTGDKVEDGIILIGTKEAGAETAYIKNINIIVQDGSTKVFKKFMPGPLESGYEPKLLLGDFNGDKVSDILTSIANGGSGGTYYYSLIGCKDSKIQPLFDQVKFSKGLDFEILFRDNFKAEVKNKELKKNFTLDLSDRKDDYLEMKVYDDKGKLLAPVTGFTAGIISLNPIDSDNNGTYELVTIQRLAGIANADTVGYVTAMWKYERGKLVVKSLEASREINR